MFAKKGTPSNLVIAGKSAGKTVTITPQAEPVYKEIRKLANNGNYWAQITINALHQLVSGRLHQDNIFIKPGPVHRGGEEEFVMILPGCKVTVEKKSSDEYKIVYFKEDAGYAELQDKENSPGIYQVKQRENELWEARKAPKGTIKPEEFRLIAISDTRYHGVRSASNEVAPRVASMYYSTEVGDDRLKQTGFDLHYTPGTKRIGGLINLKEARHPRKKRDISASALLLANAMFQSRKISGITWISEFGGSAILTQAMEILSKKKIKLKKHKIFLFEPKTSQTAVLNAARAIDITITRKFGRATPLNIYALTGKPSATLNRVLNEEMYKYRHALGDSIEIGASIGAVAVFTGTVSGLAGINIGAIAGSVGVAGAAAVPAIAAFMKAVSAVSPYVENTPKIGSAIDAAAEQIAPHLRDKVKRKF